MAIPDGAVPLALGTLLAVGAAALVLGPLLGGEPAPRPARVRRTPTRDEPESSSVAALREIEFDRATGKLSDADYATLKTTYTRQALAELRATDAARDTLADDPAEAAIREYRSRAGGCSVCHHPPEPDAVYCSACGHFLADACATCGVAADIPGQKFCSGCGASLG